ncbi:hypothetical protein DL765_009132 [Monosporascus sp. GIB2]|nr:hypothetical protein DL765_009132 [Monosporascus sp. GIB2]
MNLTLIDFFKWTKRPGKPQDLAGQISAVTIWNKDIIGKLIAKDALNLIDVATFVNEVCLVELQKAVVVQTKIGVDPDLRFQWFKPLFFLKEARAVAESIRKTLRARYDMATWDQVAQPYSTLCAATSGIPSSPSCWCRSRSASWGAGCREPVISTPQPFVQRCLLALEDDHGLAGVSFDKAAQVLDAELPRAQKVAMAKRDIIHQQQAIDNRLSPIQFSYWDPNCDGLLAVGRLYIRLKQLKAAHQADRGHEHKITKHMSLRQLAPLALLQLRTSGSCEAALPEVLSDMDFPATSSGGSAADYPRASGGGSDSGDDPRFRTVMSVPIASIAVSTASNNAGVFKLGFHDMRYAPFKGAGTVLH